MRQSVHADGCPDQRTRSKRASEKRLAPSGGTLATVIKHLFRAGLAVLIFATACAPVSPVTQGDLQILSKGAPTVIVTINGVERMRVTCNGTGVIRPGGTMPSPPFDLRVTRQDNGGLLLNGRITELPRWILVTRESASVSDVPVSGPVVACE